MPTFFFLARHGQSEGNVKNDIVGTNPPLTKLGLAQADELTQHLCHIQIDAVYASDLIRAKQTAEQIAHAVGQSVTTVPELRERFFGSLEGKTSQWVNEQFGKQRQQFLVEPLDRQLEWRLVDDEESFAEVIARGIEFFNQFGDEAEGKNIVAISHANMMVALLVKLGFAAFHELPYGSIKNTGYMKIEKQGSQLKLVDVFNISKKIKV